MNGRSVLRTLLETRQSLACLRSMIPAVRSTRAPLLGVLGVALPVAVAAAIAIARHPTVVTGGDTAFVEEAVVQAEHGRQLLGSVDRFGVAHLGPAHYYLLAPVYWLLGNSAYALAVGSLVLVGLASVAVVALAWRRGGLALALGGALLVLLYLHSIGAERLRDPWGPWAIMVPTLLFMVLAAAFASGSTAALPAALVVGSFIAQTHISTPPTIAAVLLLAWAIRRLMAGRGTAWPAPPDRTRHRILMGCLWALVVLAWLPPAVQQVTGHPGNLTLLARFLLHPHGGFDGTGYPPTPETGQSLHDAFSGLGLEFTVFPAGHSAALIYQVHSFGVGPSDRVRFLLVGAYEVLAIVLVVLAARRGDRFALTLGAATLLGMATAVLSFLRIVGPFLDYLVAWTTALPVALWLGWAALAAGALGDARGAWGRRAAPLIAGGLALGVAAASLAETVVLARLPSLAAIATPQGPDPILAPAAALVRDDLARSPGEAALLRIGDTSTWPVAAAVGNQLLRHDRRVAVAGAWLDMFGDVYRPTGDERVEYTFVVAGDEGSVSGKPGEQRLGNAGDVAIYRRSLPG